MSSGRRWIFLRGLGRHSLHWGSFVLQFQTAFPEDQIELLDLRGNGKFAHSPSFTSIADNVRDLRARSQLLHFGEPVYVMAISMGAMVAIEWAHVYPHDIAGVVGINTSDKGSSSFFERMRPGNYQHLLKLLLGRKTDLEIEKQILQITTNRLRGLETWAQKFSEFPLTEKSNWLRQLLAASSYHFPEHKPRTEVLLLGSTQDRLVNCVCTQNIAQMWALNPHLHPTAGHDLPLEDGAWVCHEVQNWLKLIEDHSITSNKKDSR
jgi:alpha-beta hydrolase superfamily lysophospholipase